MQLNIEKLEQTIDEVTNDIYQKANHVVKNQNDLYSQTEVNAAVNSFLAIVGMALTKRRENFLMKYDGFQKAVV